ncbi:MAG: chromosome segregation protein SMC, partial [Aquificaceae bacterium]|nr:chromosome segregation protein SMC [Aquificaceae bacterium]
MKAWIEKITLEGFKSYGKERKEVHLGPGFIAVVGPNGAGKSNIGDAISFALGIATARTLRAKNLSYLIYSRDSERADYAFVEVHFKNHGLFSLQEEDLFLSRKVYPDGRSVFRINGSVVRERDLLDFLSKAGIYETAYNVVLQGDIVKFLKMTPVERRKLIEEIAGIQEYEEKKQKALLNLGEVELKIRELRLLMDEMQVQMEKLKEELNILNLYRQLEEQRVQVSVKLYLKHLSELRRSAQEIDRRREQKLRELNSLQQLLRTHEERLNSVEEELKSINQELLPHRERVGRLSQSMENLSQRLQELAKKSEDLSREVSSVQEQIESLESQKGLLLKEEQELLASLQRQEVELLALEESAHIVWRSVKEKEDALRVSLEELEKTEQKLREVNLLLEECRREATQLELKAKELELKREKVKEDIQRLRQEEEKLKASFGETLLKRESYQKTLKEEEASLKLKKEELHKSEEKLRELRLEREELLKEISAVRAKLQGMWPEELPFEDIRGVYGRVSDLIRVKDPEHLKAVESAGGGRLSYVVVQDEKTAKECIQRLKELQWGRLSFIPLSRVKEVKIPSHPPRLKGVIDFVVNLLEYESLFDKAVKFVFGDTLLVRDFDSAKDIWGYRVVTLEGELFEKSGVISGGHAEHRGELSRGFYQQELQRLCQLERNLKEEEQRQEKLIKVQREELVEKEAVLAILRRRLEETEEKDKKATERLEDIQRKLQKAEEYLELLEQEKEKVIEKSKKLQEESQYLEEKRENLSLKRQSALFHYRESGVEDLREEHERLRQKVEELRESLRRGQLRLKELRLEKEDLRKEIGRKLAFVESATQEQEALVAEMEALKKRQEELEKELQRVNLQAYELYKRKDQLEEEQRKLQSELGRQRLKEEDLKEDLHRLNLEKTRVEEKELELLQKLQELGYAGEHSEVKESPSKLKEELSVILTELSKLGKVNFKAEEEYLHYEERYRDCAERHKKLKEEKESIKELIEEIESKKLRSFMETFRAINKNLKNIFSQLSPGGKAYMVLEREDEPLSGGTNLVVKPRGKEVQYLEAISGGEKTLAALSLIFAIQDYRPSPFYYFDEVDAHLDEANARRVGELIKERSRRAQFIVVTLREVLAS